MSGLVCVWADIPEDMLEWYENDWLPEMRAQNSIHTLHCEYIPNGFEGEPIGQLDATWPLCAVYEVADIRKATDARNNKRNHPSEELLAGPLANARFDTRTYRELQRRQDEEWDGDASQIASVTAIEWHVPSDLRDEIMEWYESCVVTKMTSSPDVLRHRLFELDNATVLQSAAHSTKAKESLHTYFSFVEFDTEDWPWDVILELAETEKWREWFEGQKVVTWQHAHYLVKRLYTENDKVGDQASSDVTPLDSAVGTSSE